MKHLNQIVTATLFVAVTLLMSLASCGGKDPREKAIEDLYLSFRNGDVLISMVEKNKDYYKNHGEDYEEVLEKTREEAEEYSKSFDERYGSYEGLEVIDTTSTSDYTGFIYRVKFKGSKEDYVEHFIVEQNEDGIWEAKISNAVAFNTDKKIQNLRRADAQAEADGFPDKGLWYYRDPNEGMEIFLDFNTKEKSVDYYDEKCSGLIVVNNNFGQQVHVIDNIEVNDSVADIRFVNTSDTHTYGLKLTYTHQGRSITFSGLEMKEKNPEINSVNIRIPDEPLKLKRDDGYHRYTLESYD